MSKSKKLFIGMLSVLPLIVVVAYMVVFFSVAIAAVRQNAHPEFIQDRMMDHIIWIVVSGLLLALLSLASLIYFIVHVINNTAIDSNERLIWILVFIFAGFISKPVYWYMRIWKQASASGI